jgi:hypothetical protein
MAKPWFLVENLLSDVQFPLHQVVASSSAAGAEVWRVATGRRSERDRWTPAGDNTEATLTLACNQVRSASALVLDRGHNLAGRRVILEKADNGTFTAGLVTVLDVVLPADWAQGGSADAAAGALTKEGAWLKRFPVSAARYWRIRVPAIGAGLRPVIVGAWLGESWQPSLYLDLPFADASRDLRFPAVETDAGWVGAGEIARPRAGEISVKLASEAEYLLAERHLEEGFWMRRPMWLVLDGAAVERAVLAVPVPGRYGFEQHPGWSHRQATSAWVEHEPRLR